MMCSRCVMNDPDIILQNGVCNYCLEFATKEKQRRLSKTGFPWIVYEMKKSKGYHCLLGLSGGVDSSLCLHFLIEHGLKPLCFSVDNGWNTPESDENIMRMVETLKVPFYRYTIDLDKFNELYQAFLKSGTKNLEVVTDHILMAATYDMARRYKIKWIISGGNLATEGIMPKFYGYEARDLTFIRSVYKRFTGHKLTGLPTISLLQYIWYRIKKVKIINFLDYYEFNKEKAKVLLKEKYGWKDYGLKHCENRLTQWFQNYYLPTKFRLDKRKPHFSSLINSGQMTREEALEKLKEPLTYEDLGFDINAPIKDYKDYKNSEFWWNLLSKIYGYIK